MQAQDDRKPRNVDILFRLPPQDAETLEKYVEVVGENRAAYLRSVLHAVLVRFSSLPEPPSTLGEVENAIIK